MNGYDWTLVRQTRSQNFSQNYFYVNTKDHYSWLLRPYCARWNTARRQHSRHNNSDILCHKRFTEFSRYLQRISTSHREYPHPTENIHIPQRISTSHVNVMAQSECGAFIERSKTAVDRSTGQHRVFIHSLKVEVPETGYVLTKNIRQRNLSCFNIYNSNYSLLCIFADSKTYFHL